LGGAAARAGGDFASPTSERELIHPSAQKKGLLRKSVTTVLHSPGPTPGHIQLAFGAIVLPVTFLGAVYYPWAALTPIPWLKYLALANPLVYISEGLRGALTVGVPHMNLWLVAAAMSGFILALGAVGIRGFRRRVID
jgi:hypothetical protein